MPTNEEEQKSGKRYPAAPGEKPTKKIVKKNAGSAKKAAVKSVKKDYKE